MDKNDQQKMAALEKQVNELRNQLEASKNAFFNVVDRSRDGIAIINDDGVVQYANRACTQLFMRDLGDLLGSSLGIPIGDQMRFEIQISHKSEVLDVEICIAETYWNKLPAKIVSMRDVTQRRRVVNELEYLSRHDALTNLPNRVLFQEVLQRELARAKRENSNIALLYLDMDGFKRVNDSLGHFVGDQLLITASAMLKDSVRETDTVARLGGDEFAIILTDIKSPLNASAVAKKILNSIKEPMKLQGSVVSVGFSIGIAVYPHAGETAEELIKNADVAMYSAKNAGRHQYKFYSSSLNAMAQRRLDLEENLRNALENDEFYLEYQPIINAQDLEVCGYEALMRWRSKELGIVRPDEFIPVLEDVGGIVAVGKWVLQNACRFASELETDAVNLFVNISMNQLINDDNASQLLDAIKAVGIDPSRIVLELTESVIMQDPVKMVQRMNALADLHMHLAIDDFGTGYSSLAYLKRLPVEIIKIDRAFVRDLASDPNDAAIVKSTIALAENMGLRTVGEGVETKEQLDFLLDHGCDMLQGFYFSKPLSYEDALKFHK